MIDMVSQDENYGLLLDNKKVVLSFFNYFRSFAQSEFPLLLFDQDGQQKSMNRPTGMEGEKD